MTPIQAAVAVLRARGFAVCKPNSDDKKPTYKGWSTFSKEPEDFEEGDQVGIICGPLSDGGKPGHAAVIGDLDGLNAIRWADNHLPTTGMMEGRPGKSLSHRTWLVPLSSIPAWAQSGAEQGSVAAKKKTGHPGPFIKSFRHRETNEEVIRFLGTGGQAVCPPATWVSKDGTKTEQREWVGGEPGEPAIIPFLELWESICNLAHACDCDIPEVMPQAPRGRERPPPIPVVNRAIAYLATLPSGISGQDGHSATFYAARVLVYGFDLGVDLGYQILRDHFNPRCNPQWSESVLKYKCEQGDKVPFKHPRGYLKDARRTESNASSNGTHHGTPGPEPSSNGTHHPDPQEKASPPAAFFTDTDIFNGRRFVKDHGEDVRYVADWNRWVVFDGKRWAIDRSETLVQRLAKETTDRMALEAGEKLIEAIRLIAEESPDDKDSPAKKAKQKAERELAHAKKSQDIRVVKRMLEAAKSEPQVNIQRGRDVFDLHPYFFNAWNGTIDLRDGILAPHRRDDFLTRICPTSYRQDAPRGEYLKFLKRVFNGKPDIAEYVRKLAGYLATGSTSDHSFHVFFGDGSNGKGVLVLLWTHVLGEGEYAHTAAAELLVNDGRDRHPTEKVGLRGARMVSCSESKEGGKLDEAKVKKLTSDDIVDARGMGQDFFQFTPTHKLILQTNHKPRLHGTDHGIRRRLRLVPFEVKFWKESDRKLDPAAEWDPEFQADPGLEERLKTTESEGILADMVFQARLFYENGKRLDPPAEVMQATRDYLEAEDIIGQFFEAEVKDDPDGQVKSSEFYAKFKSWAENEGHEPKRLPSVTRFGLEAKKRYKQDKTRKANVFRVRLLTTF